MNKYALRFLHRGMLFGGFGPIVLGIIYFVLSLTIEDLSLGGQEVFVGILSVYLLAFVHAGASVFPQIEEWPIAKSLLIHLATLYVAYVSCYLLNDWLPFSGTALLIFTLVFAAIYFTVWGIVLLSLRATSGKFNQKLG